MSSKYKGDVIGFQALSTILPNITLDPVLANDLNRILDALFKVYDIKKLNQLKTDFANHTSNSKNPHNLDIELGLAIIKRIYKKWLKEGNHGTYEDFLKYFFLELKLADDEDILGESEEHVLTVKMFHKLLYKYHFGPINAHPPILEILFRGNPLRHRVPFYASTGINEEQVMKKEVVTKVHRLDEFSIFIERYLEYTQSDLELVTIETDDNGTKGKISIYRLANTNDIVLGFELENTKIEIPIQNITPTRFYATLVLGRDEILITYRNDEDKNVIASFLRDTHLTLSKHKVTSIKVTKNCRTHFYADNLTEDEVEFLMY